ncbi:response regulator [Aquabacter sp. CN5-332]
MAAIIIGAVFALRFVLALSLREIAPFAFQLPAILLVSLLGGITVGVFGLCLALVANAMLIPPEAWQDGVELSAPFITLGSFFVNGLVLCLIAAALRRAVQELQATRDSLTVTAQNQQATLATLEALLAHAPVGFAFFDRAYAFVRVNDQVAKNNGAPVSAHIGHTVADFAPEYAEVVNRHIDRIFESGEVIMGIELEGAAPANPGVWRYWLTGFFPVRDVDGRVILAGMAAIEITERKLAERALAESVTRFRNLAEALPQMVWTADAAGQGDYYNNRWSEYTGRPFDEAALEWNAYLHPDDRADALKGWREAMGQAQPFTRECRFRAADGTFKWFLCRAMPVLGASGAVERWFGSCTDISDIVSAREALAQSREALELLIAQRTAELVDTNARLKAEVKERIKAEEQLRQAQKMEAVGQLTGGVAHDFNNLLTVIIGNLEAAERRIPATDTEIRTFLDYSRQGALRAAILTSRLLAFSRRQPLDPKPTDVNRLVTGMSELLRRTLGERVLVETVLAGGLWPAEIDPNQLENAILNLAVNARDAVPQGGKLTIETANAHLDEAYAATHEEVMVGQYVVICVSDTGTGMTQEVLERAFEPFFTTKGPSEGTGLGLSQVYGFVKQSGGHVKIYSEVGQGTTVKIYLPRLKSQRALEAPAADPAPPPRVAVNTIILVVEDDDAVRRFSVSALAELGYRVVEAATGEEALSLLETGVRPHLLFTDVNLGGGINGRELAERAATLMTNLRVLFTTAYARNAIVHHGRLDQGVKLLTKPFNLSELAGKVREVLEQPEPRGLLLLVEDEPFVAMVARQILEDEGFEVNVAGNAAAGLSYAEAKGPALMAAVVDLGLPDMRGDELVGRLRALREDLPILVASGYGTAELQTLFAQDTRIALVGKPYDSATLRQALGTLGFDLGEM